MNLGRLLRAGLVSCLIFASAIGVLGGVPVRVSAQTITVNSPSASSVWDAGGTYEINWTASGVGANVRIDYDYLFWASSTAVVIVASTANDGSYNWTIPAAITARTDYLIRVWDAGDLSVYDDSELFEIRAVARTISVTAPATASVWTTGQTVAIAWTTSGPVGANVRIEYDYIFWSSSTAVVIVASTPNDGSYDWTIPSGITPRPTYLVRVSDAGDDSVFDDSGWFEVRAPPSAISWLIIALIIVVVVVVVVVIAVVARSSSKRRLAAPPAPPQAGTYPAPPAYAPAYPQAPPVAPATPPPAGGKTCWNCGAPLPAEATTCGRCGSYV